RFSRDWSSDVCSSDLEHLRTGGTCPAIGPLCLRSVFRHRHQVLGFTLVAPGTVNVYFGFRGMVRCSESPAYDLESFVKSFIGEPRSKPAIRKRFLVEYEINAVSFLYGLENHVHGRFVKRHLFYFRLGDDNLRVLL